MRGDLVAGLIVAGAIAIGTSVWRSRVVSELRKIRRILEERRRRDE